jgi:FMN phosphatase YigB (HAD superfamily)
MIATFDIWDTCLTRSFSEPTHLFFEVARHLTGAQRFEAPDTAELARFRILAEQKARKKAPGGECRFDEIAAVLKDLVGVETCQRFMECELIVEKAFVRPIGSVLKQLETARQDGAAIAFISDMYLPSDFLRSLLAEHGFFQPEDAIFVSSEHRANKSSGELFQIVQKSMVANTSSWTHLGDKWNADVQVPQSLGIKALHYRGTEFTDAEKRTAESCAAEARSASRLQGGLRAARLGSDSPAVLTDVVAPWLCALAAKMVQRAQKMGLRRLYFLSRDGEVLMRIAQRIAPHGLECRYLHSSRRAWCFPAMLADDPASRCWLETFAVSPRGILNSLEFTEEEQITILSELQLTPAASDRRAAPTEREFVWEHLRGTGRIATVLERAAVARAACLAYLEQEGLFEDDLWAVCDVGWALNGQAALTRLLRVKQPAAAARGFYFMVNRMRPPLQETGPFEAWLLDEALESQDASIPQTFTCQSGLIEEFFLSNATPTLQGYKMDSENGKVSPVFAQTQADKPTAAHAAALRKAVDCVSEEWNTELGDPEFVADLSKSALTELLRFLRQPTYEEAFVVSCLRHASEATNHQEQAGTLARALTIRDSLKILARRARLIRSSAADAPLWGAGCQALTPWWVRGFHSLAVTPLPRLSGLWKQ